MTFRYRQPDEHGQKPVQYGLIAEEVAASFPELVVYNEKGEPEAVRYQELTPILLNELQQQAAEIRELKKLVVEMQAGELDLVAPFRPEGYFFHRQAFHRLDEAGFRYDWLAMLGHCPPIILSWVMGRLSAEAV